MSQSEQNIVSLFKVTYPGILPVVRELSKAGSARDYFRVEGSKKTLIAAYGENVEENKAFFYVTQQLQNHGINTPVITAISDDCKSYLMSDLGNTSLLDVVTQTRGISWNETEQLYKLVLQDLVNMQVNVGADFDFSKCLGRKIFDSKQVYWDLLYFKYYFVKLLEISFDEQKLDDEFLSFASSIGDTTEPYFMYRDFQARNILIENGKPAYIDYQGAMRGPLQYDVASLLYQSRAELPENLRERLLDSYLDNLEEYVQINRKVFTGKYNFIVLARTLQTLGAYGFRGMIQRKEIFLKSIPQSLEILSLILPKLQLDVRFPQLYNIIKTIDTRKFDLEQCSH